MPAPADDAADEPAAGSKPCCDVSFVVRECALIDKVRNEYARPVALPNLANERFPQIQELALGKVLLGICVIRMEVLLRLPGCSKRIRDQFWV